MRASGTPDAQERVLNTEGIILAEELKRTILIVDDTELNRDLLKMILADRYEFVEAQSGKEAIEILDERADDIDLMLLDIVMPELDGFGVLEKMNERDMTSRIPVIVISGEKSASLIERAYDLGAVDYFGRSFDAAVVRKRVANSILLYAKQKKLTKMLAQQIYEHERSNNLMVSILSNVVEFRNGESSTHILHVNAITEVVLRTIQSMTDKYQFTEREISLISMASSLHDIGKISIPSSILNKPGRLTDEEFAIMKTHSKVGADMLEEAAMGSEDPLLSYAYEICRWHHERYDGRGYPDGLKGDDIPISAQAVSVADVYDALTSERVYKPAYSHEKAMEMILGGQCGTFSPLMMECLNKCQDEIRECVAEGKTLEQNTEARIWRVAQEILESLKEEV